MYAIAAQSEPCAQNAHINEYSEGVDYMKRDIKNFSSQKEHTSNPSITQAAERIARQMDPAQLEQFQDVIGQYSGKSEQELMNELLRAKQSGAISASSLIGAAQSILPMLNDNQRGKLSEVLSQLGI